MTYPQPKWFSGNGFFYLFTKYTNGRELYWSTSKDGKTWKNMQGDQLRLPLDNSHCKALIMDYQSEGKLVYINDLNFDKNGNPVILAVISKDFKPGPKGDPREWYIIKWQNGQWNYKKVCD